MEFMCRVCCDVDLPKVDVFSKSFGDHSLAYLINRYLYLKIEIEDKFSHCICDMCVYKVTEIHKFAQLAAEAQEMFILLATEENANNPPSLADPENIEIFTLSHNWENTEYSALLTAEERARDPLPNNVENIKFPSETPNNLNRTQEDQFSKASFSGKENFTSMDVPRNLYLANNSESQDVDGRLREEEVSRPAENVCPEVVEHTFSFHTLGRSIELMNRHLSSQRNEIGGEDLVMESETTESSVGMPCDTAEENSEEQNDIECDVERNISPKQFSDKNKIDSSSPDYIHISPYICPHCDYNYTEEYLLEQHIDRCHGKTQYECDICKKVLLHKQSLFRHMYSHFEKKLYTCNVCKMGFVQKCRLDSHYRLKHKNKKPYKCKICNKLFTAKQSLKVHFLQHENPKPHFCNICNKVFPQKYLKQQHMESMHENFSSYKCDICNMYLRNKGNLLRHICFHLKLLKKLFKCATCNKSFYHKWELRKHMMVHLRRKSYECGMCHMVFVGKKRFHEHFRHEHKD